MARKKRVFQSKHEWIDPRPFADWLNDRVAKYEADDKYTSASPALGPLRRLCRELGWGDSDNACRKLYRYRRQLTDTKAGGLRVTKPAKGVSRTVVEDALHHAGVEFYDVYPEFARERSGAPDPEAWCPSCQEHVLVVRAGSVFRCAWCSWRMSKGHLNEHGIAA